MCIFVLIYLEKRPHLIEPIQGQNRAQENSEKERNCFKNQALRHCAGLTRLYAQRAGNICGGDQIANSCPGDAGSCLIYKVRNTQGMHETHDRLSRHGLYSIHGLYGIHSLQDMHYTGGAAVF